MKQLWHAPVSMCDVSTTGVSLAYCTTGSATLLYSFPSYTDLQNAFCKVGYHGSNYWRHKAGDRFKNFFFNTFKDKNENTLPLRLLKWPASGGCLAQWITHLLECPHSILEVAGFQCCFHFWASFLPPQTLGGTTMAQGLGFLPTLGKIQGKFLSLTLACCR